MKVKEYGIFLVLIILLIFPVGCNRSDSGSKKNSDTEIAYPVGYTPISTITPRPTFTSTPNPYPYLDEILTKGRDLCKNAFLTPVSSSDNLEDPVEIPIFALTRWGTAGEWEWYSEFESDMQQRIHTATTPSEIKTFLCIEREDVKVGTYTDGSAALTPKWNIRVIDFEDGRLLKTASLWGGAPPKIIYAGMGEGDAPLQSLLTFLLDSIGEKALYVSESSVYDLEFNPDSQMLAATGEKDKPIVWDISTNERISPEFLYPNDYPSLNFPIQFSYDLPLLAVSGDNSVDLLNVEDWVKISSIPVHNQTHKNTSSFDIEFFEGSNKIAVADEGGVFIYDATSGAFLQEFPLESSARSISITADNQTLVAVVSRVGGYPVIDDEIGIYIWNLQSGDLINKIEDLTVVDMVVLGDQTTLAVAEYEKSEILLLDLLSGQSMRKIVSNLGEISDLTLSDNSQFLGALDEENHIVVWDTSNYGVVFEEKIPKDTAEVIELSPDGNQIAVGFKSGIIEILKIKM